MFNSRRRRQDVKLLTATNDVVGKSFDAETRYVVSPELEAWELDKLQQAIDLKTGRFVQLISELSCKPIKVFRNSESNPEKNLTEIARESQARERTLVDEEGEYKDSRLLMVMIFGALVLLAFLIVVWKAVS